MVVRDTFQRSAIVLIGVPLSTNVFSNSKFCSVSFSGLPTIIPHALAEARPNAERSKIRLRSNSTNVENKENMEQNF